MLIQGHLTDNCLWSSQPSMTSRLHILPINSCHLLIRTCQLPKDTNSTNELSFKITYVAFLFFTKTPILPLFFGHTGGQPGLCIILNCNSNFIFFPNKTFLLEIDLYTYSALTLWSWDINQALSDSAIPGYSQDYPKPRILDKSGQAQGQWDNGHCIT
jgi:hypothetical protein